MTASGWYRHGVQWILVDQGGAPEYWLDQNPNAGSIFAEAKRLGMDIVWICSALPVPGNVQYTGEVIVNGERMDRNQAKARASAYAFNNRRKKSA
jgi:hypothetical protein